MKKSILLWGLLLVTVWLHAQSVFRHIATLPSITSHITTIDNAAVNSQADKILIVTPDWGTGGPYHRNTVGVWFNSGRWKIFNQNTSQPMTENVRFNILAAAPGVNAFIHSASAATISGHVTTIDNPALNGQPGAKILITQNYGSTGPYNNHPVGVYFEGGRWRIFNQDFAAMPVNAKFNIYIDSRTFSIEAATPSGNWYRFNNAATDGHPEAFVFSTQLWSGVYNANETGVWYHINGWTVFNQNMSALPARASFNILALPGVAAPSVLTGWIDMHTHPMSKFGFGKEFFFGNVDGDPAVELGSCGCIHNFVVPPFDGSCGQQNMIRNIFMDKLDPHTKNSGYPDFNNYPTASTTTHQQMWWEWLDRARRGGLKSIVALAQNSHTLADGMETSGPYDDLRSMNEQITELTRFVRRHRDIMDTVTSAARMREVASSGRLAVIIGIEMDNIGNFYNPAEKRRGEVYNATPSEIDVINELDRLYDSGVRYIFPVHITNNVIGGASLYGDEAEPILFNLSNAYNTGSPFVTETVSASATGIGFKEPDGSRLASTPVFAGITAGTLVDVLRGLPLSPLPSHVLDLNRYSYPDPGAGFGHRNILGLTPLGRRIIPYMMQKGFMIDIDHMSEKCVSEVMDIAWHNRYPLNSGHNGPRSGSFASEKQRTAGHYDTLRRLGGMVGVGTGSTEASRFLNTYRTVLGNMDGRNVTIGTDVHVGAKLPGAPSPTARLTANVPGLEVCCNTGSSTRRWDFNSYNNNGVSHYGLMPEFIQSVRNAGMTNTEFNAFNSSAEYFAQMWERCESRSRALSVPAATTSTINIPAIGTLCPSNLVAGDREFAGHGPRISGNASLRISTDGRRLELLVSITAVETEGDRSEVRGSWVLAVGPVAPAGRRYVSITSPTTSTFNQVLVGGGRNEVFEGCDGGEHTITVSGGLINSMTMVGDTGGADISNDADCNCDTRITRIILNNITVTLMPL